MAWPAVVLILISAVFHSAWNAIAKKCDTGPAFFGIAMLATVILFLPMVPFCMPLILALPAPFWIVLALTTLCQAFYFYFLGRGYAHGEMSIVYPIARSYPIIVVTVVSLGFGRVPTWQAVIGVALIVAGCFCIQLKQFNEWDIRRFLKLAAVFALFAAGCSAGYSICDKYNIDIIGKANGGLDRPLNAAMIPMFYNWIINLPLSLTLFALARKGNMPIRETVRKYWGHAIAVGVLSFAAYGLVLAAMRFVDNVSYVVAFRQVSILLTVLIGIAHFGEQRSAPKITGAVVIFAGLVLVGIFGK
ncbi:MAG: DMT family transporter [Planctomycetota bacterium]